LALRWRSPCPPRNRMECHHLSHMSPHGAAPGREPTLKWHTRDDYDEAGYAAHLERLAPHLPPSLRVLSEGGGSINLHDAWLIDAREGDDAIVLDIAAYDYSRSGWNQAEVDLHVRIVYHDAEIHGPSVSDLWLWRRSGVEILASEYDRLDDGRFVHRFLVAPETADAMAVSFASAELVAVRFIGTDATTVGDDS
jgi:hypothetical protein